MTTRAKTALVQARVDQETKREADALFSELGMDTPTAIRVFLRQALERRGLPFEVSQQPRYNATTEMAIAEAETLADGERSVSAYSSWNEFQSSLGDER